MSRRVTIPEAHVAIILPNQLADELMSLCKTVRTLRRVSRADTEEYVFKKTAGDVMLALLEARES